MRLITKLTGMRSTLRRDSGGLEISDEACGKSTEVFARSAAELESCLLEARSISQLLHDAGSAMPAHRACMPLRKRPEEEGQAFALAQPIENEMEYPNLLSSREREVVALLAKGQSNKEIGNTLVISTRTVETHRARIMLKLDMRSLGELIRYAV